MEYVDTVWQALKAGQFPTVTGEEERKLKIAFIQGVHTGRQFILQAVQLDDISMVQFSNDLQDQIAAELRRLGTTPGNIDVGIRRIISKN